MRKFLLIAALLFAVLPSADAQFGSFSDVPVEVDAEGETRFEGGLAVAEDNVVIRYAETSIYCDYAQYSPDTHEVFVRGNVRIYRDGHVFVGERAIYNLETKQLRTADFRGAQTPFSFSAETIETTGGREIKVRDAIMTTSPTTKPDYYLKAKGVRIYPDDRVIFTGVTLYVGRTPVFWWPYLYQSLKADQAFSIAPGYSSRWGAFVLTKFTFPLTTNMSGEARLDLRSARGIGVGFGTDYSIPSGKVDKSWASFRSYYADDSSPNLNKTNISRSGSNTGRYRLAFQSKLFISEDVYATIDLNKLSDSKFLEDFEPGLFSLDPQPNNVAALTKWDENYTLTGVVQGQLNPFYGSTERLPEVALDIKRQPLFGTGIFYEGEASVANLNRRTAETVDPLLRVEYDAVRADTFHQISYPKTYLGWLSVIPRAGVRGTYYSDSGRLGTRTLTTTNSAGLTSIREVPELIPGGSVFRGVVNGGVEASFKFSREWEDVQSRAWGLDGLRHVVQPYTDFSLVYGTHDADQILQFDRLIPSTELPPTSFPQFNSIDSISDWTILRLGVRNRLQTRRDDTTFSWLEMDTYFNVYLDNPGFGGVTADNGTFSNVFNRIRWTPLPWVSFTLDSQIPLLDSGFTEINTRVNFMVTEDLQLNVGHRFLEGNPFFRDSNQVSVGGYYRIDDNWGFSARERYEITEGRLDSQLYELHRDLSSWVASLGVVIRDNGGNKEEFGVLLSFTLKDLPNISLPVALDPQAQGLPGSENR